MFENCNSISLFWLEWFMKTLCALHMFLCIIQVTFKDPRYATYLRYKYNFFQNKPKGLKVSNNAEIFGG